MGKLYTLHPAGFDCWFSYVPSDLGSGSLLVPYLGSDVVVAGPQGPRGWAGVPLLLSPQGGVLRVQPVQSQRLRAQTQIFIYI